MQIEDITKEIETLEKDLLTISNEIAKLRKLYPEEWSLHAIRHGKGFQYFVRTPKAKEPEKYIKKRDKKTAAHLAQIEYDKILVDRIQKRIEGLKMLLPRFSDPFETALAQMAYAKRDLIIPHHLSDEAYIRKWKNQDYIGLTFEDKSAEYYTRKGLRVRSKSEILIADILDDLSIPFLYEKPLHLNSEIVHPDFTLLNIKQRKEMYWEHFGMMDDMDYRNKAFLKIRKYEANGLFRHDSFIWTFETGRFPLDTKTIRKMVKEIKATLGYLE
ncbi:MAG: hypothetical protein J5757_05700 [Lachnospiraceae bacterium]|nr:hypothetical protein [Lachnospiraceae bacterium]